MRAEQLLCVCQVCARVALATACVLGQGPKREKDRVRLLKPEKQLSWG